MFNVPEINRLELMIVDNTWWQIAMIIVRYSCIKKNNLKDLLLGWKEDFDWSKSKFHFPCIEWWSRWHEIYFSWASQLSRVTICSQGGHATINVIGNNKLKIFDRQFSIFMRLGVSWLTDPLHVIREYCVVTWVQLCTGWLLLIWPLIFLYITLHWDHNSTAQSPANELW